MSCRQLAELLGVTKYGIERIVDTEEAWLLIELSPGRVVVQRPTACKYQSAQNRTVFPPTMEDCPILRVLLLALASEVTVRSSALRALGTFLSLVLLCWKQ